MELERCYSVLAVSSSQKFNESIRGLLPESRYFPVKAAPCLSKSKLSSSICAFVMYFI